MIDLLNSNIRQEVVKEIDSWENQKRKQKSQKEYDIYRDKILPYVQQFVDLMYGNNNQIPVVSSINISRRICQSEASLYKKAPKRTFIGLNEKQIEIVNKVYEDMMFDVKMQRANIFYRLQNQTVAQVALNNGQLELRNYLLHQIDAIPGEDPSRADAYVVSGFDRSLWNEVSDRPTEGVNQIIADKEDYKSTMKMRSWWSKEFNFISDKEGNPLPGQTPENVLEILPFVDIAQDKDYTYWVDSGSSVTDFTVEFNADLTDDNQIARMQGFGQAYWKGDPKSIPENIKIGPSYILKIPVNPNNPVDTEFGFANANPDLSGLMAMRASKLAMFLTSRGHDPKILSTTGDGQKFNSGLDRLLYMIEKFEASQADIALFTKAEQDLFKIIVRYLEVYGGTEGFKYPSLGLVPQDAYLSIQFAKPEVIQTESERTDLLIRQMEAGLKSKPEAISDLRGITIEEAEKKAEEISLENMGQDEVPEAAPVVDEETNAQT